MHIYRCRNGDYLVTEVFPAPPTTEDRPLYLGDFQDFDALLGRRRASIVRLTPRQFFDFPRCISETPICL